MKAEEIKNKTNEAVAYLVEALQSGQSRSLTQGGKDLGARELVYCKGELAASVENAGR